MFVVVVVVVFPDTITYKTFDKCLSQLVCALDLGAREQDWSGERNATLILGT